MANPLLDGVVGLASQVFSFLNTLESRKYIDEIKDIKLQILAEEQKGADSDDALIEDLYARLGVIVEACNEDMSKQQGTSASVPPAGPAAASLIPKP